MVGPLFRTSELGIVGIKMPNIGFPPTVAYAESYVVKGGAPDRTASPKKQIVFVLSMRHVESARRAVARGCLHSVEKQS